MKNNSSTNKGKSVALFHLLLLIAAGLLLLFLSVPEGCLFGSKTDWYCQHVTLADSMRKHFYATGQLLPDFSGLGGGSNFYTLSYYGLLRPDVLLSFFLPKVPVSAVMQGYAVFGLLLGACLLYGWLLRKGIGSLPCLTAGFLYLSANCQFQAHRQIMFVNYLPFVILALFFLDRLMEGAGTGQVKKSAPQAGLVFSLLMLLLHSFYFFPASFAACTLYLWCRIPKRKSAPAARTFPRAFVPRGQRVLWGTWISSTVLAVCLSMAVLLPTGLVILENKKDAKGASLLQLLSANPSLNSLLYSTYGCGLTLLCLYTLLLSIRRKETRRLAGCLFTLLFFQVFYWLLNGTLYARPKSLIPFLPLLLFLAAKTLDELLSGKCRHSLPIALLCLLPGAVQLLFLSPGEALRRLILLDNAALLLYAGLGTLCQRLFREKRPSLSRIRKGEKAVVCILLCILPAMFYLEKAKTEDFVPKKQDSREAFSQTELRALCGDSHARFDTLTGPVTNCNYVVQGLQNKSTLYSSVSNSRYNQLFYDLLKMPVSSRNRVAMTGNPNPFQEYLMGVRYLWTTAKRLPVGYEIKAQQNGQVLAENKNVLPMAYGSTALMKEADFDSLAYPQTLEFLMNRTVVPKSSEEEALSFPSYSSQLKAVPLPEDFFAREGTAQKASVTKTLPGSFSSSEILLLSFDVSYRGAADISVTINGVKNCLSGKNAPYPNRNTTFTYLLSGAQASSRLTVDFSKGNYKISRPAAWVLPASALSHPGITPFQYGKTTGSELLNGRVSMDRDGYFVTSFAFSRGYSALVDGKKVTPVVVNKGFVGFPIKKGTHEIILKFHAPGKAAGLFISFSAAAYFIFTYLYHLLLTAAHKNGVLHRVRVVTLSPSVADKAHPLIKPDGSLVSGTDLQMDTGHPTLRSKTD